VSIRWQCICVDSTDPSRIAPFWEQALGWRRTYDSPDEIVLEPPVGSPEDGVSPDLLFLRVPEEQPIPLATFQTTHEVGTTVVMFADIADSTALTERLGDLAFRAKARELDDALRSMIRREGGNVIDAKTLGDGVLATFPSASHAMTAALASAAIGQFAFLEKRTHYQ